MYSIVWTYIGGVLFDDEAKVCCLLKLGRVLKKRKYEKTACLAVFLNWNYFIWSMTFHKKKFDRQREEDENTSIFHQKQVSQTYRLESQSSE